MTVTGRRLMENGPRIRRKKMKRMSLRIGNRQVFPDGLVHQRRMCVIGAKAGYVRWLNRKNRQAVPFVERGGMGVRRTRGNDDPLQLGG